MGKKDNQSGSKNQINHSKSVYKTVNSFSSNVTGGKDFKLLTELKCVYTNADSFMNKFDEFRTRFINDESDPHIIMITEALPKNSRYSTSKAEFNLEGYDLFPEKFPIQDTRGILVYIKQDLKAVEVNIDQDFKECVLVKLNLRNRDKLLVGCIYKSPSSSDENHDKLNELLLYISKLEDSYTHILLAGDYNFPDIDWNSWTSKEKTSLNFLECIRDCFFQQVVENPTRYRINQESSLLDLIIVNDSNYIQNIEHLDPVGRSDHCVLSFTLKCYLNYENTKTEKFNYFKGDYDKLRQELDIDWNEILNDKNTTDMIDIFMSKLTFAMKHNIQTKRIGNKKGNTPLSLEARRSIRKKHRSWEKYRCKQDSESYKEYTKARNKAKSIISRERKNREKQIAETAKSNSKHFWSYVNSKRKTKSGVSELHTERDGIKIIASDDGEKAEILADFFSSVFTIENDDDETLLENIQYDKHSNNDNFTLTEVNKLLKELNTTKSPGPDQVHPKVLYELTDIIDKPLCTIFNSSFKTGTVPEGWRIGQITALFKKGSKNSASNYRPVSLTSIICKLMEKLIRKRIIQHMDKFDLFSIRQFGFMGGRSTTLQLLKVLDHWTTILDNGGTIDTIYTDFMKAFDKVPHIRLITKLRSYGISNQTCVWVKNFLSNRKQKVQLNGSVSKWHNVTSGIPQGSVLGPVLFVIFINDLPLNVESDVYMFADDTKLYRDIANQSDIEIIQNDINNLFKWSEKWLLRFHPDKCKVLSIIGKRHQQRTTKYTMPTYSGSHVTLESVESEKDIGVTIDVKLNFEKHIQTQVNKANQIVGIIRRSFKYLDFKTFCLLFKSLVRPILEYASSVWNPYKTKDIEAIENVQRRATKMLPDMKDLTYEERLKKLKLPSLRYRRLRGDMIETFKIVTEIYDKRVTEDLLPINKSSFHQTRGHSLKLTKNRSRLDIRKYYFTNRVVDDWNNLPETVINAKNVKIFENR